MRYATAAGENIIFARPPKIFFPAAKAITHAITGSFKSIVAGSMSVRISASDVQLRSSAVNFLPIRRTETNSTISAAQTHIAPVTTILMP